MDKRTMTEVNLTTVLGYVLDRGNLCMRDYNSLQLVSRATNVLLCSQFYPHVQSVTQLGLTDRTLTRALQTPHVFFQQFPIMNDLHVPWNPQTIDKTAAITPTQACQLLTDYPQIQSLPPVFLEREGLEGLRGHSVRSATFYPARTENESDQSETKGGRDHIHKARAKLSIWKNKVKIKIGAALPGHQRELHVTSPAVPTERPSSSSDEPGEQLGKEEQKFEIKELEVVAAMMVTLDDHEGIDIQFDDRLEFMMSILAAEPLEQLQIAFSDGLSFSCRAWHTTPIPLHTLLQNASLKNICNLSVSLEHYCHMYSRFVRGGCSYTDHVMLFITAFPHLNVLRMHNGGLIDVEVFTVAIKELAFSQVPGSRNHVLCQRTSGLHSVTP